MGAIFLGTPAAAIPSLAALAGVEDIDLVVTPPDRRAGRGRARTPSPVKVAARQFGYRIAQPETRPELVDVLTGARARFGLVVAYGQILTPAMLASADLGFLNVHFSLLPRWRGAAPVERAIAAGDERTGVTLMKIDEGLDTGPVIGERATPIGPVETGGSLTARLAYLGASLVDSILPDYLSGRRRPVPQLETEPTLAARLTREDAMLVPTWSAARAERSVRAYTPRPGAWFALADGPLRVHAARLTNRRIEPGALAEVEGSVVAGFSDGGLLLETVQPAGKPIMSASDWMHGRRGEPGAFGGAGG